jgi:hypothetical protein
MPRFYRENGFESAGLVASNQTSGTIISAPGTGYSLYLLGASCFATQRYVQTTGSGATIVNIGSGSANFPSTIKVQENTSVYAISSQPSSLFYYIDRS